MCWPFDSQDLLDTSDARSSVPCMLICAVVQVKSIKLDENKNGFESYEQNAGKMRALLLQQCTTDAKFQPKNNIFLIISQR